MVMTAKELLFLLKEAEQCFWDGFKAATEISDLLDLEAIEKKIAGRNQWEAKGREVKAKLNAGCWDADCTPDGCFWFLYEKEAEVVEADTTS